MNSTETIVHQANLRDPERNSLDIHLEITVRQWILLHYALDDRS